MHRLEKLKPLAQFVLRWAVGIVFISHGFPKLFTARPEHVAIFQQLGFPGYFNYIAGVLEVFGGSLLALGLFTRPVALLLTGEMAIALWKVRLAKGVLAVSYYELPLLLAAAAFTLMVIGPGAISIDRLIFKTKS